MALNSWVRYFFTDYGQFFENLTGDEIVAWGFFCIEEINGGLDISSYEAGDRRFKLVERLQELNGFFCQRWGTGGVRLKYGG
jgi:hypothetical protein